MKILHAIVGYLALTALPFHPGPAFAFAFALVYESESESESHDGYLTSSIQETCQKISTQNHAGDSAFMKCVPRDSDTGDILEARQDPGLGRPSSYSPSQHHFRYPWNHRHCVNLD